MELTVNNCTTTDTIIASYIPLPTLDLGNDTTLCQGETLTLNATTANATYLWQDNSANPTFHADQQSTYWVEVNNYCGTNTDTLTIEFKDCDCSIYIPNAFTPNNDGINDVFAPKTNCDFNEYIFMIFNRWGEKIYETQNRDDSWDGTHSGQVSSPDVYIYRITYQFEADNIITKYGSVTLMR